MNDEKKAVVCILYNFLVMAAEVSPAQPSPAGARNFW
jgi:hypothetical protein